MYMRCAEHDAGKTINDPRQAVVQANQTTLCANYSVSMTKSN